MSSSLHFKQPKWQSLVSSSCINCIWISCFIYIFLSANVTHCFLIIPGLIESQADLLFPKLKDWSVEKSSMGILFPLLSICKLEAYRESIINYISQRPKILHTMLPKTEFSSCEKLPVKFAIAWGCISLFCPFAPALVCKLFCSGPFVFPWSGQWLGCMI